MLHSHPNSPERPLIEAMRAYVRDILGVAIDVDPGDRPGTAPPFIEDRYALVPARLFDRRAVLMIPKPGPVATPAAIAKHRDQVRKHLDQDLIVLLAGTLGAHDRYRLIHHRVPFIVPGNQMYVPDLALDLREHFRSGAKAPADALTPAAQLIVLQALLGGEVDGRTAPQLAARYRYSRMTMVRAIDELGRRGLADVDASGKPLVFKMRWKGRDLWERARPLLRSPVRKRRRIPEPPPEMKKQLPLAGESALAALGELAEPLVEVRAVAASRWDTLRKHWDIDRLPAWDERAIELETWSYDPTLPGDDIVDPLSLWLSLPEASDERFQMAKEELLRRVGL